jgi:hypothetical protein
MKARNENNAIKVYPNLPNEWGNILNFPQASVETLEAEGFYDLVEPEINQATQRLGELYFDEVNQVFTFPVIDKTQAEIDYEAAIEGWHHPEFLMRIIAPDALLIQAPGIETWARYKGLPVIVENDSVYLYCDFILPVHQSLLSAYQEVISIEMRPEP